MAVVAVAAILPGGHRHRLGCDERRGGENTARSQTLESTREPGTHPGCCGRAARLTALATAYGDYRILTPGRRAERNRWQAMADCYTRSTRSLAAETARLNELAEHYLGLSAPQRAAADRYQGMADSIK